VNAGERRMRGRRETPGLAEGRYSIEDVASATKSGSDLGACLVGWACGGLLIGLAAGSFAVRINPSLRDPADARHFLALTALAYLVVFALSGLAAGALARAVRRRAAPADDSWLASCVARGLAGLVAFGVFWLAQLAIGTFNWRGETNPQNVLASSALALLAGVLALRGVSIPAIARALARASRPASAVLLLACGALFLGAGSLPRAPSAHAGGPSEPVAAKVPGERPARRVLLIGIDGADWGRIDPLLAAGRLPNFERLCARGVRAPLTSRLPTWSPILWNTISTGRTEDEHGVLDFTELELWGLSRGIQRAYPKMRVAPLMPHNVGLAALLELAKRRGWAPEMPVTALQRRVKSVWNVLSERGVEVGVVRWFASWPAEEVRGYLVSDNDPWSQAFAASKDALPHVETDGFTWPPELAGELGALMGEVGARERNGTGSDPLAHPILADLSAAERADALRTPANLRSLEVICHGDRFATSAALELLREKGVEFLAVYLRGIDNVSHRLSKYTGVVDRTYEWTDALIGELCADLGDDTSVLVVSDHGWCYDEESPLFMHNHGPDGVAILSGAGVRAGAELASKPSLLDVAPTVLALFGVPASLEMPGSAISAALTPEAQAAAALARVPTHGDYHPRWSALPSGATGGKSRAEAVELLRDLGYLDGAE